MSTAKPDLTRVWASGAPGGNVVDPDVTTPGKFAAGWLAEVPPFEHFNFIQKFITQALAHINEQGICEWDADTTYPIHSLVKGSDGEIYISNSEQSGNDPTSEGSYWSCLALSNVVKKFVTVEEIKATSKLKIGDTFKLLSRNNSHWEVKNPTGTANGFHKILNDAETLEFHLKLTGMNTAAEFGVDMTGATFSDDAWEAFTDNAIGTRWAGEGTVKLLDTWLFKASNITAIGAGFGKTNIKFINASGGTCIAGASASSSSLSTIANCQVHGMSLISTDASTDFSIGVDLTTFSYSVFDIETQSKRADAILYHGQGNAGSSPYYNWIRGSIFGGPDYTQVGFNFAEGVWAGGSNGPNANIIGPILRAASLKYFANIKAGNGNMFNNCNGESIADAYFMFNDRTADDTGTSTGSNTAITLANSGESWTTNQWSNGAVMITGGTGNGQTRVIANNTNTTLTVREPWAIVPDNTSTYSLYYSKASSNQIIGFRAEGLSSLNPDFIIAKPGADKNKVIGATVDSLGSGIYVRDTAGSPRNKWYGESQIVFVKSVENIGANASVDVFPRNGAFGGMNVGGNYVVDWIKVNTTEISHGGDLVVNLDVGGASVGNGDMTLQAIVKDGETQAMDMSESAQKVERDGTNKPIFCNIATGSTFDATTDVNVSICVTLV